MPTYISSIDRKADAAERQADPMGMELLNRPETGRTLNAIYHDKDHDEDTTKSRRGGWNENCCTRCRRVRCLLLHALVSIPWNSLFTNFTSCCDIPLVRQRLTTDVHSTDGELAAGGTERTHSVGCSDNCTRLVTVSAGVAGSASSGVMLMRVLDELDLGKIMMLTHQVKVQQTQNTIKLTPLRGSRIIVDNAGPWKGATSKKDYTAAMYII